jgi:heat shock protein HslJ
MACVDPAIEATEGRFMGALQGASSVSIDPTGRMILDGSGGSITFEVAEATAGASISVVNI